MEQIAERQIEIMDRIEASYTPVIATALKTVMLRHSSLVFQQNAPYASITPDNAKTLIDALKDLHEETIKWIGELMLEAFSDGLKSFREKQSGEVQTILNQYFLSYGQNSAAQILETSEQQIRDLISGGMTTGQAQEVVYSALTDRIPGLASVRAKIITRTEAHTSSQFASQLIAQQSSIPLDKVWLSVRDNRTRSFVGDRIDEYDHLSMNGTRVGLMENFPVPHKNGGIESLFFPGDPNGSAGNVINCRCVQTYERRR